jgi:prepilin-type N-terminal cleavage/methylation domain-containing protein
VRLDDERGYSLVEMLAVLAILGTIVGAITTLFVSGSRAQVEMNQRFEAQNTARLALDRLRRDVHCANGTSGTSTTSVTLTYAATGCNGGVSITWCTGAGTNGSFKLFRLSGAGTCATAGREFADWLTTGAVFTYQTPSVSSLAKLRVDIRVKLVQMKSEYRLCDALVLRNTIRQGSAGTAAPPC